VPSRSHGGAHGGAARLRLTLLGIGAMNSPRFAPAGLLARWGSLRIAIDGGPGAEPPRGLHAWLVTDEHAELRAALRRLAQEHGVADPAISEYIACGLRVRPFPVEHTSHPACGYQISAGSRTAVWAPEFWRFPDWADGADLMFAEAAAWNRPIRFRGGVGGHAPVTQIAAEAARRGVRRLVYAHIGRPVLRAMDEGFCPPFGEWGVEGRTYTLSPHA
jgi:Beta-lactamase superfamily domain